MIPELDVGFLIVAYIVVITFFMIQRRLRQTEAARSFRRGAFEKGSMLLIGASVGVGLCLPLLLDILGIAVFPIGLVEGMVALIVMVSGLGLRIWAAISLGKYYSVTLKVVADQKVTMNGPYSWVRHPGYLGEILMWTGFGVLVSNLLMALLLPLMFVAVFLYRISVEEKMLVQELGEDYVRYQRDVRRLVPAIY